MKILLFLFVFGLFQTFEAKHRNETKTLVNHKPPGLLTQFNPYHKSPRNLTHFNRRVSQANRNYTSTGLLTHINPKYKSPRLYSHYNHNRKSPVLLTHVNPNPLKVDKLGTKDKVNSSLSTGLEHRRELLIEKNVKYILKEVRNASIFLELKAEFEMQKTRADINKLKSSPISNIRDRKKNEKEVNKLKKMIETMKIKLIDNLSALKPLIESTLYIIKDNQVELKAEVENELSLLNLRIVELSDEKMVNKLHGNHNSSSIENNNNNKTRVHSIISGLRKNCRKHPIKS